MNSNGARTRPVSAMLLIAALLVPEVALASGAESSPELRAEWEAEWADWYPDGRPRPTPSAAHANAAYHPLALTELSPERDLLDVVLARVRALIEDLAGMPEPPDLAKPRRELASLEREAGALPRTAVAERRALYMRACALRRGTALLNPLLDFEEILFAKTPMDQLSMYGLSGGVPISPHSGIFVLAGWRDDASQARDLVADSEVADGRLAGQMIAGRGCFVDPDLDYDGRRIVFAWNEQERPFYYYKEYRTQQAATVESARHVFRINIDGTDLRQLTEGVHPHYAPCWLPNGRIAFIGQRDPGTNRCRFGAIGPQLDEWFRLGYLPYHVPRIYSMRADGTDIRRHSVHDAAEWTPSVTNDGRLIYGRWDYIDRPIDLQSFWTSYPDGRDQRSPHGNYPADRRSQSGANPQGATYMRAIPGTGGRYVYISSSHRIYECGSVLHLDLNRPDDGNGAQLKEITPDLEYPHNGSAGGTGKTGPAYSTPWPLSEKYYLVAFRHFLWDERIHAWQVREAKKRGRPIPAEPSRKEHGLLGLYLLDVFGNRVLLYRDPEIDCMKPIPLRPRPRPPVIPDQVRDGDSGGATGRASIAVMNVYASDFDWPEDTKITALRIVQVFQNYGGGDEPPMGYTGMALPRTPLGTVPVYEDGSAWFHAPVNRMLYFQALDENGLAVQSMRSGTVVHPGETLSCVGCHENKWMTPLAGRSEHPPLAFRRGRPDPITPEVNGHEPFTFARHVQPVLTAKCAACHVEKNKGPLDLADTSLVEFKGGRNKRGQASASFAALRPYTWFYAINYGFKNNRSVAGEVGARASKLIEYLDPSHYEVRLTPEQRRRITLWMDLGSPYYVSIFERDKQHAGELVYPRFDFDPKNPMGLDLPTAGVTHVSAGRANTVQSEEVAAAAK